MNPLRHPPFARFWFARVASTLSFHMLGVAVGWQVYSLTGRAFDLGLVGLAQFLPMVALTLLVGQAADRYDRRLIVGICLLVEAGAATALGIGTATGTLTVPRILAIVAVLGAARAFENPTMTALLPGLVPREMISRGSAWSASATQTAQIVGPAVGGLLYGLTAAAPYAAGALMFFTGVCLMASIPAVRAPRLSGAASFFSGLGFIRRHRILLGVLSLDLFAVLLGGVTALLPIYARDILHTGPWGLGLLRAAPAVGALAMSLVLTRNPPERRVGRTMFGAVVAFGCAILVFSLSRSLPLSLVALFALGVADVTSVVIRFSLLQLQTPDEMRGRVSAAFSLFTGTSNQLGEFRAGATAALLGAVPAAILGGIGTIAVALVWMTAFPELRRIRTLDEA
jgi:MFS family permease